jgi:hypothetical protein
MRNDTNVCIVGAATNTNNSPLTETDARMRLQQAAHILVTGAIRAAQKHKSEAIKRVAKPPKSSALPISDNHTLDEFATKNVPDLPTKKTCKRSHLGRTAEGEKA